VGRAGLVGFVVVATVLTGCPGGGGDVHAVISARPASVVLPERTGPIPALHRLRPDPRRAGIPTDL